MPISTSPVRAAVTGFGHGSDGMPFARIGDNLLAGTPLTGHGCGWQYGPGGSVSPFVNADVLDETTVRHQAYQRALAGAPTANEQARLTFDHFGLYTRPEFGAYVRAIAGDEIPAHERTAAKNALDAALCELQQRSGVSMKALEPACYAVVRQNVEALRHGQLVAKRERFLDELIRTHYYPVPYGATVNFVRRDLHALVAAKLAPHVPCERLRQFVEHRREEDLDFAAVSSLDRNTLPGGVPMTAAPAELKAFIAAELGASKADALKPDSWSGEIGTRYLVESSAKHVRFAYVQDLAPGLRKVYIEDLRQDYDFRNTIDRSSVRSYWR